MNTPVFTDTKPIGIVLRDLDATLRHYPDDVGIGPWTLMELPWAATQAVRNHGAPAPCAARRHRHGRQVLWELIDPRADDSLFARCLASAGGGVHHIPVATPHFGEPLWRIYHDKRSCCSQRPLSRNLSCCN